jgi:hypothetical protein
VEVCSRGVAQGKRGGGGGGARRVGGGGAERSEAGGGEAMVSAGASWIKFEAFKLAVGPSTTGVCGTQPLPAQHTVPTTR